VRGSRRKLLVPVACGTPCTTKMREHWSQVPSGGAGCRVNTATTHPPQGWCSETVQETFSPELAHVVAPVALRKGVNRKLNLRVV
jgi:hypothetical protein